MSEFSKAQIATILSALDDRPRNPANREAGLKALGKRAARHGCSVDDVLAAAPGLLDGRLSPAAFRAELGAGEGADAVVVAAATPAGTDNGVDEATQPNDIQRDAAAVTAAPQPAIRPGTKQALMIDLLRRPEGATVAQIAAATGWQHHTVRGAISGALKKRLGLQVAAIRITALDADGATVKGRATVYKIRP